MKFNFKLSKLTFLLLGTLLTIMSCVKKEFDAPPTTSQNPEIPASEIVSLEEVMKKLVVGRYTPVAIDKYVKCVVVADDRSGNFFKNIILEDFNSDLGISVLLDQNEINAIYPIGRTVFLKLTDLTISEFNGLPQLGMGVDASGSSPRLGFIPSALVASTLIKGASGVPVVPRMRTISTLTAADLNTLIQLDGVEFQSVTPTTTYAENKGTTPQSVNHNLTDCAKNVVIVRNSGYSDFAAELLPSGNGKLTAIYSVFRNDKQLFIRDPSDIVFDKARCGQAGGDTRITAAQLRIDFKAGKTTIPAVFVQGVVISDGSNGNIDSRTVILQDGDAGIALRFSAAHNIPLNKTVKININGLSMAEFRGLLQVATVTLDNVQVIGNGSVTPKQLTVNQINLDIHESTLVIIKDAELSGGATLGSNGGNITLKDATGSATLFTRSAATFASQALKTGKLAVTTIVSEFDNLQLQLRKIEDIEGGGGGGNPNPTTGVDEKFDGQSNNADINIPGWENIATKGTRKWQAKLFSGNLYAQSTAFNDSAPEMETWLITPEVVTATYSTLSFESANAFPVHDGLSVWYTTNYTGDPASTTWTKINAKLVTTSDPQNTFISSGNIDLKGFGAKVRIAFKYNGAGGTNTSTFRIDNVVIK